MSTPETIPLPKDPRHQRYADGILAGLDGWEAYREAYSAGTRKPGKDSAHTGHKRLKRRADVIAYMRAVRGVAAKSSVLTVIEKREFLARIVRTPLMSIDPNAPDFKDGDLIRKFKSNEDEFKTTWEIEKLDPLKAIELDDKAAGEDPATNLLAQLAEALTSLGNQSSKMDIP